MTLRSLLIPPRDAEAEPVCLLTREWAERRQEPPDRLLNEADASNPLPSGIEYRFKPRQGLWERLRLFAAEEAECCPFLEFQLSEDQDEVILGIVYPQSLP